jgi:hypothetical protein
MITAVAGFHIILYSVPPMRPQRRPSAAPAIPAVAPGDRTLETAEPVHPASSPPRHCVGAGSSGPAVPNQPRPARRSSTTITATTLVPQGPVPRVHRPPLRSLRPPRLRPHHRLRLRRAHAGRAAGGEREGARRLVSVERDGGLRGRSLQVGGVRGQPGTAAHSRRSPGYGRDPPP